MEKRKILLPNGRYVERVIHFQWTGNFLMGLVTINKSTYTVGDGDEYMRGLPSYWKLSYSSKDGKYVAYSDEDVNKFGRVWIDFGKMGVLPCSNKK